MTVIEAKLTRDTETFSKMDPYCKISTGAQNFRTETKDGAGKTPVWDETFTFEVENMEDEMKVIVCEADIVNDDEIGQFDIKLQELCVDAGVDEWYTILWKGKSAGKVHLKTTWTPN